MSGPANRVGGRVALALLAAAAIGLPGCGGGDSTGAGGTATGSRTLTAEERSRVREHERTIQAYCTRFALYVAGQRKPPPGSQEERALAAVDNLIELGRDNAFARVERGVNLRLAISDLAENLEGSNCDARIIGRLNAGLSELPQR